MVNTVIDLLISFLHMALLAVGGAVALLPEIARLVVGVRNWITETDLVELATIGQAAPGPNMLLVTLIGWKVAGIPGAIASTIGFCAPSATIIFTLYRKWDRLQNRPWKVAVQNVLGPLGAGLALAGAVSMGMMANADVRFVVMAVVVAALDSQKTAIANANWLPDRPVKQIIKPVLKKLTNPLVLLATAGFLAQI